MAELKTKIILRNGTTAEWASSTRILDEGEIALEYCADGTVKQKAGDGSKTFAELPYIGSDVKEAGVYQITYEYGVTQPVDIDEVATAAAGEGAEFQAGDILVIKTGLDEAKTKYSYTSYVYDTVTEDSDPVWQAMDGNYSASNVYFTEDLLTTTAIGNISLSGGQATIPAAGSNLVDVFNTIYVKEDDVSLKKSSPTAKLSDTNTTYYEIGTTGTKNVTVSMSEDGEYKYGYTTEDLTEGAVASNIVNNKTTGVVVNTTTPYQLYLAGTEVQPTATNGATFTLEPAAKNAMGSMNLYGVVNYQQGNIPVSNLKKAYPAQRIGASSVRTHAAGKEVTTFAWYIPFFQGFSIEGNNNVVTDHANITEAQLKALTAPVSGSTNTNTKITGANAYSKTKLTTAVAPSAWRQYFLAYPKDWGYDMSGAKDGNGIDCTVNEAADITMSINGNDVVYKVYYIHNATPYGTMKITWALS